MAQITLNSTGVASNGALVLQSNGTTAAVTIDTSQRVAFVAGTAALPAITTTGDTNTGIFFPAADTIAFSDGGVEAMRLDASGNLGLNNTSPTTLITSIGGAGGKGIVLSGQVPVLYFEDTNGTDGCIFVDDGNIAFVNGTTERARITSSGNLLVGTTSAAVTGSNYGVIAFANGRFVSNRNVDGSDSAAQFFGNAGALYVQGNGNCLNTNNSYGSLSDSKLKENVTDATPKLAQLNQVRIVNYNLIGDNNKQLGVIAQELEQVFPSMIDEAVDRDEEGNDLGTTTKSVKYSVFVPMLIKAIQEQQALITQLTARITALEGA